MASFEYNQNPSRVLFGSQTILKLPQELKRLSANRPLILTGPKQAPEADKLRAILRDGGIETAGVFSKATMHTPVNITEEAMTFLEAHKADAIVSFGGGSVIGLGKALALRTGLPNICVVTTYSGSEMTNLLGASANGVKKTFRDPKVLPTTVIYDVDYTMSLPVEWSCYSAINAMAHAVEALYTKDANPVTSIMTVEAIRSLTTALPGLMKDSTSLTARSDILYGAWLCSSCVATMSVATHHKLVHTLGSFKLPHAETHTLLLPHSVAFLMPALSAKVIKILADVLPESGGDPVRGLNALLSNLKLRRPLKDFGMTEQDVERGSDLFFQNPYFNPRDPTKEQVAEIYRRVWAGEPARADL